MVAKKSYFCENASAKLNVTNLSIIALQKSDLRFDSVTFCDKCSSNNRILSPDPVLTEKTWDPDALAEVYDKEAILNSDDELNSKLFTERDPGMIAAAAEYLETEGENTFFLAVGAGHMVNPGGIVSGLKELGYTVELVP